MSAYQGHCICGAIQVSLKEQPPNSLRCYCRNCGRSGGGASINYVVDEPDVTLQNNGALKTFEDTQTVSGNRVARQFCGNCGSPVITKTPKFPGKAFVKASLFDHISPPNKEIFTDRRQSWEKPLDGAEQI
ncbi:Mss4-like protein [Aspergillus pseudodeflectus]|uniref:Mss4-like protein n=1 Tax=Aspergillus pseudodeflectus TaxID=176178 RepID=A0ABR4L1C7_9EURO